MAFYSPGNGGCAKRAFLLANQIASSNLGMLMFGNTQCLL